MDTLAGQGRVYVIHCFGDFELDAARFELSRGGALRDVQPRVLEVIEYLVRYRARSLARELGVKETDPRRIGSLS